MDRLDRYRETLTNILNKYAAIPYFYSEINNIVIVSSERDRFLLVNEGWEGKKHIHHWGAFQFCSEYNIVSSEDFSPQRTKVLTTFLPEVKSEMLPITVWFMLKFGTIRSGYITTV